MKVNVFLCDTEYHILLSIMLAVDYYGSDDYCNRILLCNNTRLGNSSSFNLSRYGNIEYCQYDNNYIETRLFINDVISICTGTLFVYNMNNPQFFYLFYKLKSKQKSKIAFVQEGLASYNRNKYTLVEKLRRIKLDILHFYHAHIYDITFYTYIFSHKGCFGRALDYYCEAVESALVDEFWLTIPEDAQYGKDKVCRLPEFTHNSTTAANYFFKYKTPVEIKPNDIVIVDQGIEGSVEFVNELSSHFRETNIYLKLHPRTNLAYASLYNNANIYVLSTLKNIPVELFLMNLKNNIVLTPYSSALLINNPSCHYYYVYRWFMHHGYLNWSNEIYAPGKHIRIIDSICEIGK